MDKTALLLAGPILSAIGIYFRYRKKSIGTWLNERRIDTTMQRDKTVCQFCGSPMKTKTNHTGPRAGKQALVCSKYPDCRNIDWSG